MIRRFLPDISFCESDTRKVEEAVITKYEELTNTILYPGDPVRLFLEGVAYLLARQNNLIDFTGKQNLLNYAWGEYLDHLGFYLHTTRADAKAARAIFRFTLSTERGAKVIVPAGTRIRAGREMVFQTVEEKSFPPGVVELDIEGVCQRAGTAGNDLLPGQITTLMDPIAYVATVANITTTAGGREIEDDENLRLRTSLATERYGSAGPIDAYRYHIKSVHQGIIDEAVWQAAPGEVYVAPLMDGGEVPTDEIISEVHRRLHQDEIRPFTDSVTVIKPEIVTDQVEVTYYILVSYGSKSHAIIGEVNERVQDYLAWQRSVLGRDILPSKLVELVQSVEGVQRVEVASPRYRALHPWEVGHVTVSSVEYGGLSDD